MGVPIRGWNVLHVWFFAGFACSASVRALRFGALRVRRVSVLLGASQRKVSAGFAVVGKAPVEGVWRADLWLAASMALLFQLLLVASTALGFRSGFGFWGLEARADGAPPCPAVRCWGVFPVARGSWAGCVRARVPVVCGPSPKYLRTERIRGSLRCRQTFPIPFSASCACYLSCRPC